MGGKRWQRDHIFGGLEWAWREQSLCNAQNRPKNKKYKKIKNAQELASPSSSVELSELVKRFR